MIAIAEAPALDRTIHAAISTGPTFEPDTSHAMDSKNPASITTGSRAIDVIRDCEKDFQRGGWTEDDRRDVTVYDDALHKPSRDIRHRLRGRSERRQK
jgi:hypothetical protein